MGISAATHRNVRLPRQVASSIASPHNGHHASKRCLRRTLGSSRGTCGGYPSILNGAFAGTIAQHCTKRPHAGSARLTTLYEDVGSASSAPQRATPSGGAGNDIIHRDMHSLLRRAHSRRGPCHKWDGRGLKPGRPAGLVPSSCACVYLRTTASRMHA